MGTPFSPSCSLGAPRWAFLFFALFILTVGSCRKQEDLSQEGAGSGETGEEIYRVEIGSSPIIGNRNAPVTVINFSDFECPFSKRVFEEMGRLLQQHSGDIAYVYKHFPLAPHRQARRAAKAAIAANRQGKFPEMYRIIFENNQEISEENIFLWAEKIGLDRERFEKDFKGSDGDRLLQEDITAGNIFGVRGTPTLFINGRRFSGANLAQIERAVTEEIAHGKKLQKQGVPDAYAEITKNGRTRYTPPKRPAPVIPKDIYAIEPPAFAPLWGPHDAPITVIFFGDLECPFSARFHETLEALKKEFDGKIRVAFAHLPLKLHPHAVTAAKATIAAGRQEKFWEFLSRLFTDQPLWKKEDASFDQSLDALAQELGIDAARFRKDMEDPRTMEVIHRDLALADILGVRGTPGVFINGRYASGAFPLESFQVAIREELERAKPFIEKGLSGDALYAELIKGGRASLADDHPPSEDPAMIYRIRLSNHEPTLGKKDAPVVIVEFSDFQCAPCAAAAAAADAIGKEHGDRVRIVYKHFPLFQHAQSEEAARFALAVKRLSGDDKYRIARRRLFDAQSEWGTSTDTNALFERYAKDMGLDWGRIHAEMASAALTEHLAEDRAEAAKNGIRSVPVFFVNGKKLSGPRITEQLKALVADLLKEKPGK